MGKKSHRYTYNKPPAHFVGQANSTRTAKAQRKKEGRLRQALVKDARCQLKEPIDLKTMPNEICRYAKVYDDGTVKHVSALFDETCHRGDITLDNGINGVRHVYSRDACNFGMALPQSFEYEKIVMEVNEFVRPENGVRVVASNDYQGVSKYHRPVAVTGDDNEHWAFRSDRWLAKYHRPQKGFARTFGCRYAIANVLPAPTRYVYEGVRHIAKTYSPSSLERAATNVDCAAFMMTMIMFLHLLKDATRAMRSWQQEQELFAARAKYFANAFGSTAAAA